MKTFKKILSPTYCVTDDITEIPGDIMGKIVNELKLDFQKIDQGKFILPTYNALFPHENNKFSINELREKYKLYFNRLIKILKSNSKILFVITKYSKDDKYCEKNIVDVYLDFFNTHFPGNEYYFFTPEEMKYGDIIKDKVNTYLNIYQHTVLPEAKLCFEYATKLFGEMNDLGKTS